MSKQAYDVSTADDEISDTQTGLKTIATDAATKAKWAAHKRRPTEAQVIGDGFDIILFDEAHLGSTSARSRAAIENFKAGGHTAVLLITATYTKPVCGYKVSQSHLCTWSLTDVSYARSGNLKALAEAHGEKYLRQALEKCNIIPAGQVLDMQADDLGLSAQQLAAFTSYYTAAPKLNLKRLNIDFDKIKGLIPGLKPGQLNFKTLLQRVPDSTAASNSLDEPANSEQDEESDEEEGSGPAEVPESDEAKFRYPDAVRLIIDELLKMQEGRGFQTVQAFLHCGGRGSKIIPTCQAFQEVVEASAAAQGKSYDYLILSGSTGSLPDNIRQAVQEAWAANKDGLILLTGCKGGVGLDVKEIDQAVMLTDCQSIDCWMQRSFRCLTERLSGDVPLGNSGKSLPAKQYGVVVEPFPHRALLALLEYASPNGTYPTSYNEALSVLNTLGDTFTVDDGFFEGLEEGPAAAAAVSLHERLAKMYCAMRLVTAASSLQQIVNMQLQLQPAAAKWLAIKETAAPWLAAGSKGKAVKGKAKDSGGSNGDSTSPEGSSDTQETDESADQQQQAAAEEQYDVSKVVARVAIMLTCMSMRSLASEPTLEALLLWLQPQDKSLSNQLKYSMAALIGWVQGCAGPDADSAAFATADQAWSTLFDISKSLKDSHPEFLKQLLQLTNTIRWQLQEAINKDSRIGSGSDSSSSSGGSSSKPCSNKRGIAEAINDALALCGKPLAHQSTPLGLVHNVLGKLEAANPSVFSGPPMPKQEPAAQQDAAADPPAAAPESSASAAQTLPTAAAEPLMASPSDSNSQPSAQPAAVAPAACSNTVPPRTFLDLGAGTGIFTAAVYDRLLLAGWQKEVIESQMLYVSEPDVAMQYLLAVVFPCYTPVPQEVSNDVAPPHHLCNVTDVLSMTFPGSQPQPQFNVVLGYLPHRAPGFKKGIASHQLACEVLEMLAAGGHALLLMHNRWRASKGLGKRRQPVTRQYEETRQKLKRYLGDVWDVVLSSAGRDSLLPLPVAKNGGEQLVHLIKTEQQQQLEELRQTLGYKHLHSDQAVSMIDAIMSPADGAAAAAKAATQAAAVAATEQVSAAVKKAAEDHLRSNDAIVQSGDLPILAKVALCMAKDSVADAAAAGTNTTAAGTSAAAAGSNGSSTHFYSLLTKRVNGMEMPKAELLSSDRTDTHCVQVHATKNASKGKPFFVTKATAEAALSDQYTVVTTRSADRCIPWGTAAGFNTGQTPNQKSGYLVVLKPELEVYAGEKALVGWGFETESEAENFKAYLQSSLVNLLVSLQKPDSKVGDMALRFIPLPDMTKPWTDERCQELFGFSEEEMKYIESRAKGEQQIITDRPDSSTAGSSSPLEELAEFTYMGGSAFGSGMWAVAPARGGSSTATKKRKASSARGKKRSHSSINSDSQGSETAPADQTDPQQQQQPPPAKRAKKQQPAAKAANRPTKAVKQKLCKAFIDDEAAD